MIADLSTNTNHVGQNGAVEWIERSACFATSGSLHWTLGITTYATITVTDLGSDIRTNKEIFETSKRTIENMKPLIRKSGITNMVKECAYCNEVIDDDDDDYYKSDMSYAHDKCIDKLYECSKCSCYVHLPVFAVINGNSRCADCV